MEPQNSTAEDGATLGSRSEGATNAKEQKAEEIKNLKHLPAGTLECPLPQYSVSSKAIQKRVISWRQSQQMSLNRGGMCGDRGHMRNRVWSVSFMSY